MGINFGLLAKLLILIFELPACV